jgi:hypothetical protein
MQLDTLNRALGLFLGGAALLVATGCASRDKLTEQNFRQIRVNASTETDVQDLIGEPNSKLPGLWMYQRPDKHLTAMVDFDESGKVVRVQWIDALGEKWEDSDEASRNR